MKKLRRSLDASFFEVRPHMHILPQELTVVFQGQNKTPESKRHLSDVINPNTVRNLCFSIVSLLTSSTGHVSNARRDLFLGFLTHIGLLWACVNNVNQQLISAREAVFFTSHISVCFSFRTTLTRIDYGNNSIHICTWFEGSTQAK